MLLHLPEGAKNMVELSIQEIDSLIERFLFRTVPASGLDGSASDSQISNRGCEVQLARSSKFFPAVEIYAD